MSVFEVAAVLIGVSALFGYLNHVYLRLPHTIGLVLIALVASLPNNEYKVSILTITYVVVLFSIIVQGLTVQPLVRKVIPAIK